MQRRTFLQLALGGASLLALSPLLLTEKAMANPATADSMTKVIKSDADWKRELSPEAYDVLRHEGTEAPFTSPLNKEKHAGVFACAGCALPLFPSTYKFDSGTGWPSFFNVIPGHIETRTDNALLMARTEYHCARCGGHQGHVFEDGPRPTGLRYCNNGIALKFIPA